MNIEFSVFQNVKICQNLRDLFCMWLVILHLVKKFKKMIRRSKPLPKILAKKPKATTKVTLTSHQKVVARNANFVLLVEKLGY